MHEWALAESIILTIVEKAKTDNKSVIDDVEIVVGELQGIDIDILKFALDELIKMTRDESGVDVKNFRIVEEKANFKCNRCGYVWSLSDVNIGDEARESIHFIPEAAHSFIQCPRCGSHDFEIIRGRGIYIRL